MRRLLVLTALSLVALPTAASAQRDGFRLGAYLITGFGGDAEVDTDFIDFDVPLDPSVGFGVRGEGAVHDYVSLGGNFEVNTFEADGSGFSTDREAGIALDVFVRGRYPVELNDDLTLEPYAALPIGFTALIAEDAAGDDDVWPGWNIGLLFGAYLVTSVDVGVFLELGWRHHQWFHESPNIALGGHQFALQAGASYLF